MKNKNINESHPNSLKKHNHSKQTIYWDVDDVVLNSLETAIKIINEWYNIPNGLPIKTKKDARDWNLKSIYKDLTPGQLEEIFCSDDFWNNIYFKPGLFDILNKKVMKHYNHEFITKGTELNLSRKEKYLKELLGPLFKNFKYVGIPSHQSKKTVDMSGGIFIDDNMDNILVSNAKIKILLTNGNKTDYNNAFGNYNKVLPDNLYFANDLYEVGQILDFNLE